MKKFFLFFAFVLLSCCPVFAEKTPVKISPIQVISTHHNEIEIGDWIDFEVAEDVYNEDNLFLKKGTRIIGVVDFVHPNGWLGDAAEISFKKFVTVDANHNKIVINYPIVLNGNILLKDQSKQSLIEVLDSFILPVFFLVRGSEISIEPDTRMFTIFIEQL